MHSHGPVLLGEHALLAEAPAGAEGAARPVPSWLPPLVAQQRQ